MNCRRCIKSLVAGAASLTLLFLSGCASSEIYTVDTAPDYLVIQAFSPFYMVSPMQERPDASLPANTRIKLLRREMGYSQVQIDDGRVGYVSNDAIVPAPPAPRVEPEPDSGGASTTTTSSSPRRSASDRGSVYRGPQVNDIPLPDLDIAPEDIPAPGENATKPRFRY